MALIVAVTIACLYEYGLILFAGKKPVSRVSLVVFGIVMMLGALAGRLPVSLDYISNVAPFFIAVSIAGIFAVEMFTPNRSLERVANTLLGVMLIPWALMHLISIRLIEPYGEYFIYIIFFSVWAGDSAAYFIGKAFGKHRLNEEVSPKKSIEGSIAGLVATVAVAVICWNILFPWYITLTQVIIIGVLIAVLGQLSDLAESLIKRSSGIKDSSNILPGHGGVLDRFDSYLLIAPVLYYVILFMVNK